MSPDLSAFIQVHMYHMRAHVANWKEANPDFRMLGWIVRPLTKTNLEGEQSGAF